MTRGAVLRTAGVGAAGVLLLLLGLGLAFWRPQMSGALVELDPPWVEVTSWTGLRVVGWAALAGGAWLLAHARHRWRSGPDQEPVASQP